MTLQVKVYFFVPLLNVTEEDALWLELTYIRRNFQGFQLEISKGKASLFSHGSGSPDECTDFLQAFLQAYSAHQSIYFTWAEIEDHHRPKYYSGGAVYITAAAVSFLDVNRWLASQMLTPR